MPGQPADPPVPAPQPGAAGRPPELVRAQERLQVATRWVTSERVVAQRRIVSEVRRVDVTIRREELVIVREPLPEQQPAAGSTPGAQQARVIVLREEVPVVTTMVRPYEQVTLTVDRVGESQTIEAVLRSEQIDLSHIDTPPTGP